MWLDELVVEIPTSGSSSASKEIQERRDQVKGWLRPKIKARIISKSFLGGKYYNVKCIVQDVTFHGECIVKTANGNVIDHVKEHYLETYIPQVGGIVMVVLHKDRSLLGQLGKVIERNNSKETVLVQLDHTLDFETLLFDEVAEYVEGDY